MPWGWKQKSTPVVLSAVEAEVSKLDDFVGTFTPEQRLALARIVRALLPVLASQAGQVSVLPIQELRRLLGESAERLLIKVLRPKKLFEELGQAFLTKAPHIRDLCCEQAREYEASLGATGAAPLAPIPGEHPP